MFTKAKDLLKLTQMTGKNLFDYQYPFAHIDHKWVAGDVTHYTLKPNTTYVLSTNYPIITYASVYIEKGWRTSNYPTSINSGVWLDNPRIITTDATGKVSISLRKEVEGGSVVVNLNDLINGVYFIQLELGTVATDYAPYAQYVY